MNNKTLIILSPNSILYKFAYNSVQYGQELTYMKDIRHINYENE